MAAKRLKRRGTGGASDGGEFRGRGTVKTALIRGNTFAAKSVQYVEIDGLAIFEGDIVLGTAAEVERMTEQLRTEMVSGFASSVVISGPQFRWPNCRIPFTIDPALPNQQRVHEGTQRSHQRKRNPGSHRGLLINAHDATPFPPH